MVSYRVEFNMEYGLQDDMMECVPSFVAHLHHGNKRVGTMSGHFIHASRARSMRLGLKTVAALVGEDLLDYVRAFYSRRGDNTIFIESVRIHTKYRGLGLANDFVDRVVEVSGGGFHIVALKPFPLQFGGKVIEDNRKAFTAAQDRLRKHWEKGGFNQLDNTKYWWKECV